MISRHSRLVPLLLTALLVSVAGAACQKVPLLAPSGSVLTLTASNTAVPVNGTVQLSAQLLEASGQPPHSGTLVIFTTSLGTIEPASVETDVNGRAVTTFKAGTANGNATITASSGGASASGANAVKVAIGTAAVGRVGISANPTLIPALGGSSIISVNVYDINGNALTSAPVSFTTTAGTIDNSVAITDANGVASVTLRTATTATVTATVGATSTGAPTTGTPTTGTPTTGTPTTGATSPSSASVTVNVAGVPSLVITPPATPPNAGLPATFTFTITPAAQNGSAIRDVTVNWGDGNISDLGAISGTQPESHVYQAAGSYQVNAVVVDSNGNSVNPGTSVTVVATPTSTINITPPTVPAIVAYPFTANFTIQVTPPTGVGIVDVVVDFGDGHIQDLGGLTGTVTVTNPYSKPGSYLVRATVTDTLNRSNTGTVTINLP